MQDHIRNIINTTNTNSESFYYCEITHNVRYVNVDFNEPTENGEESITGEANLALIVHKDVENDQHEVLLIQKIFKCHDDDIIIGILTIGLKTNQREFAIHLNSQQQTDKKEQDRDYIQKVIKRFLKCVKECGAVELEKESAVKRFNKVETILPMVSCDESVTQW